MTQIWVLESGLNNNHFWAKFKIVLVRKLGRKFYYLAKFQVVFLSNLWIKMSRLYFFLQIFRLQTFKLVTFPWFQTTKVMVFPSNFWKTTIIWQFLSYFEFCSGTLLTQNWSLDFTKYVTKAGRLVKFQSPWVFPALGL